MTTAADGASPGPVMDGDLAEVLATLDAIERRIGSIERAALAMIEGVGEVRDRLDRLEARQHAAEASTAILAEAIGEVRAFEDEELKVLRAMTSRLGGIGRRLREDDDSWWRGSDEDDDLQDVTMPRE